MLFPVDGSYYDAIFNTFIGTRTLNESHYLIISATDLFASANLDLNMFISQKPIIVNSNCKSQISIVTPIQFDLYFEYDECIVDSDSLMLFDAKLYPGD